MKKSRRNRKNNNQTKVQETKITQTVNKEVPVTEEDLALKNAVISNIESNEANEKEVAHPKSNAANNLLDALTKKVNSIVEETVTSNKTEPAETTAPTVEPIMVKCDYNRDNCKLSVYTVGEPFVLSLQALSDEYSPMGRTLPEAEFRGMTIYMENLFLNIIPKFINPCGVIPFNQFGDLWTDRTLLMDPEFRCFYDETFDSNYVIYKFAPHAIDNFMAFVSDANDGNLLFPLVSELAKLLEISSIDKMKSWLKRKPSDSDRALQESTAILMVELDEAFKKSEYSLSEDGLTALHKGQPVSDEYALCMSTVSVEQLGTFISLNKFMDACGMSLEYGEDGSVCIFEDSEDDEDFEDDDDEGPDSPSSIDDVLAKQVASRKPVDTNHDLLKVLDKIGLTKPGENDVAVDNSDIPEKLDEDTANALLEKISQRLDVLNSEGLEIAKRSIIGMTNHEDVERQMSNMREAYALRERALLIAKAYENSKSESNVDDDDEDDTDSEFEFDYENDEDEDDEDFEDYDDEEDDDIDDDFSIDDMIDEDDEDDEEDDEDEDDDCETLSEEDVETVGDGSDDVDPFQEYYEKTLSLLSKLSKTMQRYYNPKQLEKVFRIDVSTDSAMLMALLEELGLNIKADKNINLGTSLSTYYDEKSEFMANLKFSDYIVSYWLDNIGDFIDRSDEMDIDVVDNVTSMIANSVYTLLAYGIVNTKDMVTLNTLMSMISASENGAIKLKKVSNKVEIILGQRAKLSTAISKASDPSVMSLLAQLGCYVSTPSDEIFDPPTNERFTFDDPKSVKRYCVAFSEYLQSMGCEMESMFTTFIHYGDVLKFGNEGIYGLTAIKFLAWLYDEPRLNRLVSRYF